MLKKMTVIELFNSIVNGKEPNRILYKGYVWNYNEKCMDYYNDDNRFTNALIFYENNWLAIEIECIFYEGE